ncbi:uromodulin-like 1 [Elephas maximus indicus]|uniref:uromodulin-like 1 n=1 Tax=Elephas maximus indicus TaxID=99487 RepID=UPI0021164C66|nr:uromodulin-like 1 [Elephas maximus indicus]
MLRTLGMVALVLLHAAGLAEASSFTEKGLSLLSYQLCNYQVTQNVQKVVSFQASSSTNTSCGGWIPWQWCSKTIYRTQYLAVEVPETRNVTDCCQGYEQLGLYCVLPLNRSGEFASRPGVCPAAGPGPSTSPCTLDTDCPGLQKCCRWSGGHRCMDPVPPALEKNPANFWYNVTVLVKMDFMELNHVDPQLLNHMRLLHSMVTSVLQPLGSTVHHLHSASGEPLTTVSQLLLGLPRQLPVVNVSAVLGDITRRVYEVINIQVQDVNECLYDELNTCSGRERCLNTEGSYQCVCPQELLTSSPLKPNRTCEDCPPIRNYMVFNVTSSSFQVSWSLNSTQSHMFHVQVFEGEELVRSARTRGTTLEVVGLEAGVLYGVKTSYRECGADVTATLTVRTDARVFEVTIRITNRNFTEQLLNHSSVEYQDFSRQLLQEVEKSFPPAVSDLYRHGKLRVEIVSLQAGSVVVKLRLTVQDPELLVYISTLTPMLPPLFTSAVFQVDQQGTQVQDWDECADSWENDCSAAAQCLNLEGSYTCQCRTARDLNPSRAGRACEGGCPEPRGPGVGKEADGSHTVALMERDPSPGGHKLNKTWSSGELSMDKCLDVKSLEPQSREMESRIEGLLPPTTGVMAPALRTEASTDSTTVAAGRSTLGTPALSHSPANPWNSTAVDQAWSPGPPPRGGEDSSTAGQDRNSTGSAAEGEEPSVAPGLATGQWRTGEVGSRGPRPTHGFLLRATDAPLNPTGQLLQNSSVESNSWLAPTTGPTGHIAWYPSPSTQDMLSTPLSTTWPWNLHPGPSISPDLPSTPRSASPKTPACVPVPIKRIVVSNVTGTSFHVAWEADLTMCPTFQLTLTSRQNLTLDLETQNTSVTLSGLEPGILYVVAIADKACGKENAEAHLKVRTAAQKLSGKVRIANVTYSECFRNASSVEYQDFLELFFRVVRNALPAPTLQLMEEGGIKMEVTGVSNGSVVVAFDLLIIADMDAREVLNTFLTALQNVSLLKVVQGDTFIQDYDECERGEDDCVPGTSCLNTLGSFTCSCTGGAPDFWVEYPGRPCKGDSPGNTIQAPGSSLTPGPEQPSTSPESRAPLVQGASPTAQSLSQRMNLTGAVRVLCEIERVAIAIQKHFLQQESIPESSLYLGKPACNVSSSNSTHVLLVAGWSECGTTVQSNMTNTVVRTTLRNDLSPGGVIHYLKILSPIHCAFRNDLLTSSGYTPEWGVYTIIEDLHGAGNFVTEMQLFIGDSPIPQNYSVSASDDIKIEVGLYRQKSDLKVVLTECWATPSSNARDPVMFGFINNSCPIPNTYTSVIENGNSNKAQFKLKIFSFINNSIVYLHCRLRICMESPEATCKINCNNFRSLKSSETPATHLTSWGPLVRSEGDSAGGRPGLGVGYVVLIVVAVFALVTGIAALLILRYQRMTGRYNFKIQSDNFSYQVFYE